MENLTDHELIVIWDMLDNSGNKVYCDHGLRSAYDTLVTKVDDELGKREMNPYDYKTETD